jgi:hypothetical protein
MTFAFLRAVLGLLLAGYLGRVVFVGIRSGVLRTRGGRVNRRKEPVTFWATAALFSILTAGFAAAAVWMFFRPST